MNMKTYILTATNDGNVIDQAEYCQLNHVMSRIKSLDTEYEFLVERPTSYHIVVIDNAADE